MKKPTRPKLPTEHQTKVLRRIAETGCMMLTHSKDGRDRYTDASGSTIAESVARALIRNGWVVGQRDPMFDLTPQSWRARTP
jgi:hypothetical protein